MFWLNQIMSIAFKKGAGNEKRIGVGARHASPSRDSGVPLVLSVANVSGRP
jgi:hypothetical protein